MSCSCSNGKCGLPKQPTYHNLHYGYIAPYTCCEDKDIKLYRKYILIDSKNLYPDDGIYLDTENSILYLTMIPDEYYYHVICDDSINVSKIVPIFKNKPNHEYNNTYKFLISNIGSKTYRLWDIDDYIKFNFIKNYYDSSVINSGESKYFEIDTTANTLLTFDTTSMDYVYEVCKKANTKLDDIDKNKLNIEEFEDQLKDIKQSFNYSTGSQSAELVHDSAAGGGTINWETLGDYCTLTIKDLVIPNGWAELHYKLPWNPIGESICVIRAGNTSDKLQTLVASILLHAISSDTNKELQGKGCLVIHDINHVYGGNDSHNLKTNVVSFTIRYKYR